MMSVRAIEIGGAPDPGDVVVDGRHCRDGGPVIHLFEPDEAVQPRLRQTPEIGFDHRADLGIAAGGVGVAVFCPAALSSGSQSAKETSETSDPFGPKVCMRTT